MTTTTTTVRHYRTQEPIDQKADIRNSGNHNEPQHNEEAGGICRALFTHLKRVTLVELAEAKPLPSEAKRMESTGIENGVLQAFLVWRHSMLLVSLPAVLFSAILAWLQLSQYELGGGFSVFGDIVWILPFLADTVLLIAVIAVLCLWGRWRVTSRILKIGWVISFILPFVPALFPLELILVDAPDGEDASTLGIRIFLAITYAINLFPILVTFPSGLARAALRIRGLLPEAMLSSWILIISAPFQSIVFLMALILLIQVAGNIVLILGTLCLIIAPWIYVFRRRLYIHAPTEETEKQLGRTQFMIGFLAKLGFIFFIVWAFTGSIGDLRILGIGENALLSYFAVLRIIFETIGRVLVNTVMFSDVLLRMTVTNWRQDMNRREGDNGEHIDSLFAAIESGISRAEQPEGAANGSTEEAESD